MSDEERIEQLELEVKVLRDNNKGLKDKIDEQSKEIEELKRKERLIKTYKGNLPDNVELICLCKKDFERNISDDYISKDKIKAKIKELEKLNDESTGIGYWFAIYYLQSLLEKE